MTNAQLTDLSESFLHFLDDNNFNKNRKTFCDEKTDLYHDSNYIWCKVCDKIYCTRCSLNHLINNQIDHNPSDKIFLRKEHFDVEFTRDCEKLSEIKKNIEELFCQNNNNKEFSQNEYKTLYKTLDKFVENVKELSLIIENFQKKIKVAIDNLQNKAKNLASNNIREDTFKNCYKEICGKFTMIEKNFYNNQGFLPTQLKSYYENLYTSYKDCKKLNDLIIKNKPLNNQTNEITDECNKLKNNFNNAINVIKNSKLNLEKIVNDIKI